MSENSYGKITEKALNGEAISREDAAFIMQIPEAEVFALATETFKVRKKYKGLKVSIQLLTNAKSGNCSQDCAYCAQSRESEAAVEKYALVSEEKLLSDGRAALENGLARHCIGLSGLRFSDEQIEAFAERVEALKKESPLPICCSVGFLTEAQALRLKAAGVDRINHNLNTSRKHYPNICSTHTWDERVHNIKMLQSVGFEICCGGILGMGESDEDALEMLLAIRDISPQAVPINFLIPLEGTPLANADTSHLTPRYCLKVLCLARLLLPRSDIRCAAGRELYLKGYEKDLFGVVDSIFASGYLTAGGQSIADTIAAVKAAGFEPTLE